MNVRQAWFSIIMLLVATASFVSVVYFGTRGYAWVVAVIPIVISTIGMGVVRYTADYGLPNDAFIYSYRTQSWAFLFGDPLALTLALWGAVKGWQQFHNAHDHWYGSPVWLGSSVALGVGLSMAWYHGMNAPGYRKAGLEGLLGSPTSQWHYYVVYMVLASALIYLGAPILIHQFTGFGLVVAAGIALWLLFGAYDAVHGLDLTKLHPDRAQTWVADTP